MRPSHAPSSRPVTAASLPCPRSADSPIATSAARHSHRRRLYRYVEGSERNWRSGNALATGRRSRRALMLCYAASVTRWSSACSITAMIGDADQAFRGFNRRDRVLANDNTFQDVLTAAGPAAISAAGVVALGGAGLAAKVRSAAAR